MPSDQYTGTFIKQSDREEAIVKDALQEFAQMTIWRNVFAGQWEEVAQLVAPDYRNTFFFGDFNWPGQKKTDRQIDATGMMANTRFAAICDSLITPRNQEYHQVVPDDDYLLKDRDTRIWYENLNRKLFRERYAPNSNFSSQNNQNFLSLGAFGNHAMFVDKLDIATGERGLRYKSIPLGELFLRESHQGLIDGFIRWFRLTPAQAIQKWGDKVPQCIKDKADKDSQYPFQFLHRVVPRTDYDTKDFTFRGMPWKSEYISIEGRVLLQEGGYNTFPLAVGRYMQFPNEVYGRGPMMMVLPALKTLNAEKRTFLKQGHRAADPVLLTADDGIVDMSLRPGAMNKGGVSADGKLLVHTLPVGEIQISEKMMEMEQNLINDAALVSLFQIMTESPQMTATEVIERTNEKGILIAPTLGRQQSEYLGNIIPREVDLLSQMRMLDPFTPAMMSKH